MSAPVGDAITITRSPRALETLMSSTSFADAVRDAMREAGARARGEDVDEPSATASARSTRGCDIYPRACDFGTHVRALNGKSRIRRMRSIFVTNGAMERSGGVTLACVHARVEPAEAAKVFQLVDSPGSLDADKGDRYAALLPVRKTQSAVAEPLPLRVEFAVDEAGDGLSSAWILVAVVPEDALRRAESGMYSAEDAVAMLNDEMGILVAYVAAVVRPSGANSYAWDVDAVPFYPRALRQLFNASETLYPFHVAWRLGRIPEGMDDAQLDALARTITEKQHNARAGDELRHWVQLLRMEQAAQQRNLENLDMFHASMVVCDAQLTAKMRQLPSVVSSFSKTQAAGLTFYSIHVPGLSEGRPLVMAGDVVYIRPAKLLQSEYALVVEYVNNRECMIYVKFHAPPKSFQSNNVHVRFTLNKRVFTLFHQAVVKTLSVESPSRSMKRFLPGCELDGVGVDNTQVLSARKVSRVAPQGDTLNREQRDVVEEVFAGEGRLRPYTVWGPPGTGKTLTIIECVTRLLSGDSTCRILLSAPAPFAADILCSRLAERVPSLTAAQLVRVNDERRLPDQVKSDVRRFSVEIDPDDAHKTPFMYFKKPDANMLANARVVVCSCTSAALIDSGASWTPTHIFVDEAAQATVPETLIPLTLANDQTAVILAGDPKQLGSTVHSFKAARLGLRKSLLELWMDHEGMAHGKQLRLCYRSHPDIVALPSRLFYDGSVQSVASKENVALPNGWDEFCGGAGNGRSARCLFYGIKGKQRREGNTSSWTNPFEAESLIALLVDLLERTPLTEQDVGVMATYRRQVVLIRNGLRARGLSAIRVGTVDDYQGQEERIIFLSTVVTTPKTLQAVDPEVGFLNNPRRFNVAISRAKALNVIVGHPLVLLQNPLWHELLRECVRRDAYRGAGSEHLPSWARGTAASKSYNNYDALGFTDDLALEDANDFDAIAEAIARTAELSLLGVGATDALGDADVFSFDDFGDEPAWRVSI